VEKDELKILVFDDEDPKRQNWAERLREVGPHDVEPISGETFIKEMERLSERRQKARDETDFVTLESLGIKCIFDDADLLIIDYDLVAMTVVTGEEIAYLVRCFSTCGVVVALNQFGDTRFDLTLRGDPESFADLNIGESFIDDPRLWSKDERKDFRPWAWPHLPTLLGNFERCIEDARKWGDRPILECLHLDTKSAGILPRETLGFLQNSNGKAEDTSLDHFITDSGNGLRRRDSKAAIEEIKPRIAAARLHRWLECFVLGGQEILVDAPHLVSRFPSLLKGSPDDLESWDSTASLFETRGIHDEKVAEFLYPHAHWLSRPAWYWPKVRECEQISEVRDPWSIEKTNWVFCEDTSRFIPRETATTFVADLPSKFNRRHVERVQGINYHPSVRFSI